MDSKQGGRARVVTGPAGGFDARPGTIYLRFDEPHDGKVGGFFNPDQFAPLPPRQP